MAGLKLNNTGQNRFNMVLPLVGFFLLLILIAIILPVISTLKTIAIFFGIILFAASFVSTEAALYILIFAGYELLLI